MATNLFNDSSADEKAQRGMMLVERAHACWLSADAFRRERERCKDYTFGNQWRDRVKWDGRDMTEEEYIASQGNIPLKNNLIRRLVRNVVGVFRGRLSEQMEKWDEPDRKRAALNCMEELYGRTMEEFLISGLAVHRKWMGRRNGISSVWTDIVSADSFFFDPSSSDPRGTDINIIGQIHEPDFATFCKTYARSEDDYRKFCRKYGNMSRIRVYEIWERRQVSRRLCHDRENTRVLKVDENVWLRTPSLRRLRSRWLLDDVWQVAHVTAGGDILFEGDSPIPGGGHPYVVKAYPFLDGEIHSFVADVIDQQRYTNRLITLYDWIMRASAKGVLMFPQDAIPNGGDINHIADQWSRFNGVIVYTPKIGQPEPKQVSSMGANTGISDLLSIQLKMMEDVSGVNGALQGRMDSATMSGQLYSQRTENALISLRDILATFDSFISDSLAKERSFQTK